MKYIPHSYQEYATEFILRHPTAAVFLDMGLGKTVITLTALEELLQEDIKKVLVIAPLRVARDTWPKEIEKWEHLKSLAKSLAVIVGTPEERKSALKKNAKVNIINRENIPWLIDESGYNFDFDMVVIDELSSFKSGKSKRFKALLKVRPKVKRIVGLTGTPSSNGLMDLWAEFRILDMGERLGRFITQYRDKYFVPDKRNAQVIFSYKLKPYADDLIYRRISDITISMENTDYLNMPECILNEEVVTMSDDEHRLYNTLKNDLILSLNGADIDASNAASLSNKLSQMANGAVYDMDRNTQSIHDNKLDALEDLIESANGQPVLVAYWFKHDLERITERLKKAKVNFEMIDTSDAIDRWNRKEIQVGLIHPASAGHGLNLQYGGSTLIWFGLTWSLELYQQTNARLWRQGQRDDTVVIYHIITKDTIDEQIIKALKRKEKTQDALIEAVKAQIGGN